MTWRGCGCEKWRPVAFQPPPCRCDDCLRASAQLLQAERTVRALARLVVALLPAPQPVTAVDIPQQRGISGLPTRTRPGVPR